jgi:hypothetical protein
MSAFDPKRTFRIQILTLIKFRVVTHELSFNDELAFCETGACHSRALLRHPGSGRACCIQ